MVNVASTQTIGIRIRFAITKFTENLILASTSTGHTWYICCQLCFYWINVCIDEALIEIWGPLIEQVNIFWYCKGFRFCGFCFSLMENWRIYWSIDINNLLILFVSYTTCKLISYECNPRLQYFHFPQMPWMDAWISQRIQHQKSFKHKFRTKG